MMEQQLYDYLHEAAKKLMGTKRNYGSFFEAMEERVKMFNWINGTNHELEKTVREYYDEKHKKEIAKK